jgi:hypothetical protein
MTPDSAAKRISARANQDAIAQFICLKQDALEDALAAAGQQHPALRKPRARGIAVSVQEALQGQNEGESVVVGWLVRAAGPGRRGETLRLAGGRVQVGSATGAQLRVSDDPSVVGQHAEIVESRGEFSIVAKGGAVKVEGTTITGKRPLVDGETIEIGASRYVFKCVSGTSLRRSRATSARSGRVSKSA